MKKIIFGAALMVAGGLFAATFDYSTLISHRGESKDAPENTMPAFKLAVERGFGFECDVYLSADKRCFTFHDGNLTRTSGGKNKKKCSEANWETEISTLDVGNWGKWKDSKYKGTSPALLEDVLKLARNGRKIYIEIKADKDIVPYVKELLAKQNNATPENALFICFSKEVCAELKKQIPEYKTYWLTSSYVGKDKNRRPITTAEVLKVLKKTKVDGVDIGFRPEVITKEFVKEIRDAGFELHVWTINKYELAKIAFENGAQTVTTDCSEKLYKASKK
jgi:glycerophosphoryl diester phosphodiesterase